MQGDSAPCGTTDRDAAASPLHLSSAPPSLISHMQSFSVWSVFSVDSSHAGSPVRSAFLVYFVYFVVSSPHAVFFCVVRVFCGFSSRLFS